MFLALFFLFAMVLIVAVPSFVLLNILGAKGESEGKTQEELYEKSFESAKRFLKSHDFEYNENRKFSLNKKEFIVPFYLPKENTAIIFGDWYKEHLISKLGISTIVVETHMPLEKQRRKLGSSLDVNDKLIVIEIPSKFEEILDLKGEAELEEIKKAYRKKVKETHPDLEGSKEEFIEVKEAYESLLDKIKT